MSKVFYAILGLLLVATVALAQSGAHRICDTVPCYIVGNAPLVSDGTIETTTTITAGGDVITDGNFDLNTTGKTLVLEDGTSASTCVGQVTANGTTEVPVATTCIETGDYVFFSAAGPDVNTANCWAYQINDGVDFDFDCDAATTTTFNWIIIKGQ